MTAEIAQMLRSVEKEKGKLGTLLSLKICIKLWIDYLPLAVAVSSLVPLEIPKSICRGYVV